MSALLTLADFTRPDLIVPTLRGGDQAGVLMELSRRLHSVGVVSDLMQFYHAAFNREFLESTHLGRELAVPHVRLPGLQQLIFALGRCVQPVPWTSAPRNLVRWVVLAAVPATDLSDYLALLAALTRAVQAGSFCQDLLAAPSADKMLAMLQAVPLRGLPAAVGQPVMA